jgi:hypothetical protein
VEACASARYWAREIAKLGHATRLIAADYVKPFVKRQKNDAADAEAICEAVPQPSGPAAGSVCDQVGGPHSQRGFGPPAAPAAPASRPCEIRLAVVIAQKPLAQEKPLLHNADRRESRAPPGLGDEPLAHRRWQAIGKGLGEIGRQELMLESGEKKRIGQLVKRQQILALTDHLGELVPTSLRWHRLTGAT